MNRKFEIVILVGGGIGNVLQALYAFEYCIRANIHVALKIDSIGVAFLDFLKSSYGENRIFKNSDNISTTNLIHSFTVHEIMGIDFDIYFYVQPDSNSSQYSSETELYLNIVKGIYPNGNDKLTLELLASNYSKKVKDLHISKKIIIFPGCSAISAVKRWPHFQELINKIGSQHIIVLGGSDELNDSYSFHYPVYLAKIVPQWILNKSQFYSFCKKINILKPFSQNHWLSETSFSFFNHFSWEELVAIMKNAKFFIGNDGGLSHLAACLDLPGIMIFGPTSTKKSKPLNPKMQVVSTNLKCQPCFFNGTGIKYAPGMSGCPYAVKCLTQISSESILQLYYKNKP